MSRMPQLVALLVTVVSMLGAPAAADGQAILGLCNGLAHFSPAPDLSVEIAYGSGASTKLHSDAGMFVQLPRPLQGVWNYWMDGINQTGTCFIEAPGPELCQEADQLPEPYRSLVVPSVC
jgi:hypothetical protein